MCVTNEPEPGGQMVCILGFSARPRGADNQPVLGDRRSFCIGERVRFVSSYYKSTPEDNPTGMMAVFEPLGPNDANRYNATQDDFVTLACWEGLKAYLASTPAEAEPGDVPSGPRTH
jgi:hypothetical protein